MDVYDNGIELPQHARVICHFCGGFGVPGDLEQREVIVASEPVIATEWVWTHPDCKAGDAP